MPVLQVPFRFAEKAKLYLREHRLFGEGFEMDKDTAHVYFPVARTFKPPFPAQFVSRKLPARELKLPLGEKLVRDGILTRAELEKHFVSSFDIAGDIAVLEIMPELESKEKQIARTVLQLNPHLKTVAKKTGATSGEFRVRKLQVLAGNPSLLARYKENGCTFEFDLNTVFFSSRVAFERMRIARRVKPKENVLVPFAGAGFYPVVIAKNAPKVGHVVGIELNPDGVRFMRQNVELNHLEKTVEVLAGDARVWLAKPWFRKWADRIVMPLPHSAHEFLAGAFRCAKKGAVIHFYHIPKLAAEGEAQVDSLVDARHWVKRAASESGRTYRVRAHRVVKTYSPHVDQVVLDVKVLN